MVLDERKLRVLRAVVEDFVSTNEPVGSKALAERHHLGVSPATIRTDMAVLEDEGYITQPHTSAGRIPTGRGYRLFVDGLSELKPLSGAERRAIGSFLDGAVDLDDVVGRTVRLLSQLTHQVAVVQYPSLTRSRVRHVELVPLTGDRVLLVVITDTGRVEQRVVLMPADLSDADVTDLRRILNTALVDQGMASASGVVETLTAEVPPALQPAVAALTAVLLESMVERVDERVVLAGTSNLTRSTLDFPQTIRPVLEALEEQVVLLHLLEEVSSPSTLQVRIGEENTIEQLRSTSLVSVGYGSGDQALAGLGVLGPTRMDYPGTMAAVRAVARYVGETLASS